MMIIFAIDETSRKTHIATVGTIMRSIFNRSFRSAAASNWKRGCPYLASCQYQADMHAVLAITYSSVATWPLSAASCAAFSVCLSSDNTLAENRSMVVKASLPCRSDVWVEPPKARKSDETTRPRTRVRYYKFTSTPAEGAVSSTHLPEASPQTSPAPANPQKPTRSTELAFLAVALLVNPRTSIGLMLTIFSLYFKGVAAGSSHGTATASSHGYIVTI